MPTIKQKEQIAELKKLGMKHRDISEQVFGKRTSASTVHYVLKEVGLVGGGGEKPSQSLTGPRVLIFDIETAPMKGAIWSLWQNFLPLDMLEKDWYILAWAAKWLGEDEVIYRDLRTVVAGEDDASIIGELWSLLDEADIVITQNGKKFDVKKANTRFFDHGYEPPRPYKHIDILEVNKRTFAHASNKLEWISKKYNIKFKKLDHAKYHGYKLWDACLRDDPAAWQEMEDYNVHDVLSLEEYYLRVRPWDSRHPNFNLYDDGSVNACHCGSTEFRLAGYHFTQVGKYQRYRCKGCGAITRGRENLFTKDKRKSLRVNVL